MNTDSINNVDCFVCTGCIDCKDCMDCRVPVRGLAILTDGRVVRVVGCVNYYRNKPRSE